MKDNREKQSEKEGNRNADSKQGTQGPPFSFSVREQREKGMDA